MTKRLRKRYKGMENFDMSLYQFVKKVDQISKKHGCNYFSASIHYNDRFATITYHAYMAKDAEMGVNAMGDTGVDALKELVLRFNNKEKTESNVPS